MKSRKHKDAGIIANSSFDSRKFKTSPEYQDLYVLYNQKYFGFRLPLVQVGFQEEKSKTRIIYGATITLAKAKYPFYITLNPKLKDLAYVLKQTLLHEMIHVALPGVGHGPKFKKEMRRLIRAGAFDGLL